METKNVWSKYSAAELKKLVAKGGVCLLKASRSMKFENIMKEI